MHTSAVPGSTSRKARARALCASDARKSGLSLARSRRQAADVYHALRRSSVTSATRSSRGFRVRLGTMHSTRTS